MQQLVSYFRYGKSGQLRRGRTDKKAALFSDSIRTKAAIGVTSLNVACQQEF
jgi:hypothetical protein